MVSILDHIAESEEQALALECELIAKENRETEWKAVNGFGGERIRIGKRMYWAIAAQYRDLYPGGLCWDDPDFVRDFKNDPRNEPWIIRPKRGTRGQEILRN